MAPETLGLSLLLSRLLVFFQVILSSCFVPLDRTDSFPQYALSPFAFSYSLSVMAPLASSFSICIMSLSPLPDRLISTMAFAILRA